MSDLLKRFIAERRAIADASTPGPWFTEPFLDDNGSHRWTTIHDGKTGYGQDVVADTQLGVCSTDADKLEERENAVFIADARNCMSIQLAALEIMDKALSKIEESGVGYDLAWTVDCQEADHFKEALRLAREARDAVKTLLKEKK